MEKMELERARGERRFSILKSGTENFSTDNKVWISYYIEDKKVCWTVRLNEIGNRVSGLSMITMLFTVDEIIRQQKIIFKSWPQLNWPTIRGIKGLTAYLGSHLPTRKHDDNALYDIGQSWELRLHREKISMTEPPPIPKDHVIVGKAKVEHAQNLNESLQKQLTDLENR